MRAPKVLASLLFFLAPALLFAAPALLSAAAAAPTRTPQSVGEVSEVQPPVAPPQPSQTIRAQPSEPGFSFFGFLLPQTIFANSAVATFGNENAVAMTEAAVSGGPSRQTFQVQQSRFGMVYRASPEIRGKVEVDFLDATKASPTVQALPRLRILKVEYDIIPGTTVFMGQDWDLFSPLAPHTYNFVGSQFRSGNSGFMREQLGIIHQANPYLEIAGSIGFGLPNATQSDHAAETDKQPAYQLRVTGKLEKLSLGLGAIYSNRSYESRPIPAPPTILTITQPAMGGVFFLESISSVLEIRAELLYGNNLANLGALTIGQATVANPKVNEAGGWLSAKYKFGKNSVFGGYGMESVSNKESLTSGTAIRSNQSIHLGYDYQLSPKARVYTEGFHFRTEYAAGVRSAYAQLAGFQLSI